MMQLNKKQFKKIESLLPRQRGNVKIGNLTIINALLYIVENGCKRRALPEKYAPWHTVYMRFSRWVKNGVIDKVFTALQEEFNAAVDKKVLSLDSTCVKVHPDGTGCQKKRTAKYRKDPRG